LIQQSLDGLTLVLIVERNDVKNKPCVGQCIDVHFIINFSRDYLVPPATVELDEAATRFRFKWMQTVKLRKPYQQLLALGNLV
jgi:hypothetical protein